MSAFVGIYEISDMTATRGLTILSSSLLQVHCMWNCSFSLTVRFCPDPSNAHSLPLLRHKC